MNVKPLYIWPWPVAAEDLALIKEAKSELAVPYQVVPREAKPGCPGRVLALRTPPEFINEHALVREPGNPANLKAALEWAITSKHDPRATSELAMMRMAFGPEVRLVGEREIALENVSKNLHLDTGKGVTFK